MTINLKITTAGRAALVNAANNGTLPVTLAEVGVTDTAFAAAAAGSDTTLPGEIKRLTTFSGAAVDDDTLHITIRDNSADTYSLHGFAVYLADGTLFGLYGSGSTALMEKSTQSMCLIAIDVVFSDIDATQLTVGNTDFLLPPATTTVQGLVELADAPEAKAGTAATLAMTPATHKAAVDNRFGVGAPSSYISSLLTIANVTLLRAALGLGTAALYGTGPGSSLDADTLDGQHGDYYLNWDNLTNVPAEFQDPGAPLAIADITGLSAALGARMLTSWTLTAGAGLTGGGTGAASRSVALGTPGTVTGSSINMASGTTHTHALSIGIPDVAGLQAALDAAGAGNYVNNGGGNAIYLTWSGTSLGLKVDSTTIGPVMLGAPYTITGSTTNTATSAGHSHALSVAVADVTGLSSALAGRMLTSWTLTAGAGLTGGGNGAANCTVSMGAPSTITGSTANTATGTTHTHALSIGLADVAGLEAALAGKEPTLTYVAVKASGHGITLGWSSTVDVTVDGTYVGGVAMLSSSPTFTGGVTAPSFTATASDPRCKRNIAPCRYGLAEVLAMDWIEYRYRPEISDDPHLHFGARTDNVGIVAPELVIHRDDAPDTLDYTQFAAVLGMAIQEQQRIIDGQAREMCELADRLAALERRA